MNHHGIKQQKWTACATGVRQVHTETSLSASPPATELRWARFVAGGLAPLPVMNSHQWKKKGTISVVVER